ncbi:hypothetical protein MVEN_00749600 [Mycena venus]|uniref:Uncharacterized protein n=1 Tax=Mycena venus TaxID=2733690 RepID=A0A8H7D638_9AGAR|nr:hypothetical protein MVEN_00749600 [Mycena venus]
MSFSDESTLAASESQGCKSISDSSTLVTITAGSLGREKSASTKSIPTPASNSTVTTSQHEGPNRQHIHRLAPTALILVHWTAVSATCFGFYFVVHKFTGKGLTLDYENMNQALGTLIAGCVYCGSMSLLLFGTLILAFQGRHPRTIRGLLYMSYHLVVGLFAWLGFLLGLLSTNPLIPFDCTLSFLLEKEACLPPAVAGAQWSKVKVVVWVVQSTLLVHSFLWMLCFSPAKHLVTI